MSRLTKRQRVDAALHGHVVDRLPVAAWRHFIPEEREPQALARAHVEFFRQFDWDWLKVNPRATYYAEAWGARYDLDTYAGVLPHLIETPLQSAADLARIAPRPVGHPAFEEQLELLRLIIPQLDGAHAVQTVFSPLSVLAFLFAQPGDQASDLGVESRFERLRQLIHADRGATHAALAAISHTLANYAAASIAAGASGIFFAIVRLARDGVLTSAEYEEFGRPYDLQVLQAVQHAPFNLLHICGPRVYFDQVLDYPVHAFNWATVGQANPSLAEARSRTDKALIGGVDEHEVLSHGTPHQVIAAAQHALAYAGQVGILLSPGCGVALDVPEANLHALRQAVEPVGVAEA